VPAATITTAANADVGRKLVRFGVKTTNPISRSAPVRPASCVWAPACSATGVLDVDADTGNPPNAPVAAFANPSPRISSLPSTVSPWRAAKTRDSTPVSANAMSAMPNAGPTSEPTSPHDSPPSAGAGSPLGSDPTTGISSRHPNTATSNIEPTTATRTPGTRLRASRRPSITATDPTPIAAAVGSVSPSASPSTKPRASPNTVSADTENPNSAGSCPMITTSATPLR